MEEGAGELDPVEGGPVARVPRRLRVCARMRARSRAAPPARNREGRRKQRSSNPRLRRTAGYVAAANDAAGDAHHRAVGDAERGRVGRRSDQDVACLGEAPAAAVEARQRLVGSSRAHGRKAGDGGEAAEAGRRGGCHPERVWWGTGGFRGEVGKKVRGRGAHDKSNELVSESVCRQSRLQIKVRRQLE